MSINVQQKVKWQFFQYFYSIAHSIIKCSSGTAKSKVGVKIEFNQFAEAALIFFSLFFQLLLQLLNKWQFSSRNKCCSNAHYLLIWVFNLPIRFISFLFSFELKENSINSVLSKLEFCIFVKSRKLCLYNFVLEKKREKT